MATRTKPLICPKCRETYVVEVPASVVASLPDPPPMRPDEMVFAHMQLEINPSWKVRCRNGCHEFHPPFDSRWRACGTLGSHGEWSLQALVSQSMEDGRLVAKPVVSDDCGTPMRGLFRSAGDFTKRINPAMRWTCTCGKEHAAFYDAGVDPSLGAGRSNDGYHYLQREVEGLPRS